jgi:ankyrin repeat protein
VAQNGDSPLYVAATKGQTAMVELLLSAPGVNVNQLMQQV